MTPAAASIDPHFRQRLQAIPAPAVQDTKALIADAVITRLYDKSEPLPRQRPKAQSFHGYREVKTHNHRVAASYANQVRQKEVGVSATSTVRKNQERVAKPHTAEVVSIALQKWGRDKSAPIARLQQIAGVDRATAAAWWHGRNPPLSHHLFTLARQIPELKAECQRLLGLEQDHHESFQREAIALLQRYAR